jgi:hypothetical protein
MNVEELNALADYLERLPAEEPAVGFNMCHGPRLRGGYPFDEIDHTGHDCLMLTNIAGHMFLKRLGLFTTIATMEEEDIEAFAAEALGLADEEAEDLFCTYGFIKDIEGSPGNITLSEAVYAIRQLVITGVVDWMHILP